MRVVVRTQEPDSLRKNAKKWKKELLAEVKRLGGFAKVPDKHKNRYKKRDVRDALELMFGNLCAYCEGRISEVAFSQIEHRKPKNKFPEDTFNWDNLHLACPKCNCSKGDKYDSNHPILDAANDKNLENHLDYEIAETEGGIYQIPKSERGKTTVKHADLNRKELITARLKVALDALKTIKEIKEKQKSDDPASKTVLEILKKKCNFEYGSVVKWAMVSFL